jgi:PAS domain S-box-containing protein
MGNIKKHKAGIVYAIIAAVFTLALLVFQYVYVGIVVRRDAEQNSKELALHTAKELANSVEVYFRDALSVTNSFANNFIVYKQNNLPRQTIYSLMKGSLSLNENFLAIWTMWEPNAYDNRDKFFSNDSLHDPKGSLAIAYYYHNRQIKSEINDTLDFLEDFYITPKKYKKPVILDPFYYQYHGNSTVFFETSLISPVMENNQFRGVIGIDIDMYALQAKYSKMSVYGDGFICLLSNSGTIVTHRSSVYLEKNIDNYTKNEKTPISQLLAQGKEFSTEAYSEWSNSKVIRYFYPINIDYMAAPWFIMIEVPEAKVFENADSLKSISAVFLIASVLLLGYLYFNVIDRRRKEKNLLATLTSLEQSESIIKEAYSQLSINEKKLEAIFNQSLSFVALLDLNGMIVRVNKPALTFIKKSENELIGTDFTESPWWHNLETEKQKLKTALGQAQKGKHITFETHHVDLDGNEVKILFSIKPIFDDNGEVIFLLPEGIDITKIKEAEQELKRYQEHLEDLVDEGTAEVKLLNEELQATNEELQAVNEHILEQKEDLAKALDQLRTAQEQLVLSGKMASLGLFTAGIAHEINNPINFISAGTQALFEQLDELKQTDFADNIELQSFFKTATLLQKSINLGIERTTEIILSLRNYSSNNSDQLMPYPIENCIKNALTILQNKYKNRIRIVAKYGHVQNIECIPGKINQLFVNILANSMDAITGVGQITISTQHVGPDIVVSIADTGEGITPENKKRLFDPFFTTKAVGKGVGLGMYIVYGIVEKHNGKIDVQSEVGVGTTITIHLPIGQTGSAV